MPTFSPPVTDGPRRVGDPNHPSWPYFKFFGSWATGQTVWKDQQGVWHRSVDAYMGGSTTTVHDALAGTSTTSAPDEGLATAQEVYLGGYGHPVTDAKAAELRAAGFFVGGHWESEEDKWTALVISNPDPNRSFIGGDATSSVNAPGSGVSFWAHADSLYGTVANGFTSPAGLVKNSLVLRLPDGSFAGQVYAAGGPSHSPAWAHPNHPAVGFTQMDMVLDGSGDSAGDVVAIGWAEPQTLDGSINDGVVMTMNAFGGAASFSALDTGGGLFLPTSVHNDATHHYVLGRETDVQAMFPQGVVPGQPWMQDRQTNWTHLARVPLGSLPTQASWEFWTGTTWASGVANGVTARSRLVDTDGALISGISDITILDGEFILATMPSTVSPIINLYRASTVQGPYERYTAVDTQPRSANVGGSPPHGFQHWYGFPKFHEYLDPDNQTFLLTHSQGLYPQIIGTSGQFAASQGTPTFVFVPKPEAV